MEKKCNSCGAETENVNIPFVVYQATAARQERQIKRMWIVVLVLVVPNPNCCYNANVTFGNGCGCNGGF